MGIIIRSIIHPINILNFWTLFIILFTCNSYLGVYGGHDLFASVSQLEDLWHNEKKIVSIIEEILQNIDEYPVSLEL